MQTIDTIHGYKTRYSGMQAACRVRIYEQEGRDVVLCTQVPEDPGMGITSYVQELATTIVQQHNLDPTRLIWIEHYGRRGDTKESFDAVRFDWCGGQARFPHWRRLTLREMMQLTGETASPWKVSPAESRR